MILINGIRCICIIRISMCLTERLSLVSVESRGTHFWFRIAMFIMGHVQTTIIPVFYADIWISCQCNIIFIMIIKQKINNKNHVTACKSMQNERIIECSYWFLYLLDTPTPARGYKAYTESCMAMIWLSYIYILLSNNTDYTNLKHNYHYLCFWKKIFFESKRDSANIQ